MYRRSVESGSPRCAVTDHAPQPSGIGSHGRAAPAENPYGGGPSVHGMGTRQPSRPGTVCPLRAQMGSCRASSAISVTSGRPSSSPWYRYAEPGSASMVSAAARARARPRGPPPYRVGVRSLSWLASTHVGAAPPRVSTVIESVMTLANASADHGAISQSKPNTWCSSSGRTYRTRSSTPSVHTSPIASRSPG